MGQLGVLGLGSRSTLFYIEKLNELYLSNKGAYSTCPFMLLNADFNKINPYLPDQFSELKQPVQRYLTSLEESSVSAILVPNITLHEAIDQFWDTSKVIHPLTLTINQLLRDSRKEVVIIGSYYTVQSDYLLSALKSNDIRVVDITREEIGFVDNVRRNVYAAKEVEGEITKYNQLISQYAKKYAVVIACTELSIVNKNAAHSLIYDMAYLQLEKAIEWVT